MIMHADMAYATLVHCWRALRWY